ERRERRPQIGAAGPDCSSRLALLCRVRCYFRGSGLVNSISDEPFSRRAWSVSACEPGSHGLLEVDAPIRMVLLDLIDRPDDGPPDRLTYPIPGSRGVSLPPPGAKGRR